MLYALQMGQTDRRLLRHKIQGRGQKQHTLELCTQPTASICTIELTISMCSFKPCTATSYHATVVGKIGRDLSVGSVYCNNYLSPTLETQNSALAAYACQAAVQTRPRRNSLSISILYQQHAFGMQLMMYAYQWTTRGPSSG